MDVRLGTQTFRVGKILCVGRNYVDHAREMGDSRPVEEMRTSAPFFFLKPATCLIADGGAVECPAGVGEVHFEAELAALIGSRARRIGPDAALSAVAGYAAFLDITARDLQEAAKKRGLPWSLSKGMDTFGPCGAFSPREGAVEPRWTVECRINGTLRQNGQTKDMVHGIASLVSHASRHMTLEPGDIIATGTPAGVGPIAPGDRIEVQVGPLAPLRVSVTAERAG
ncbi:MAG: fumarylacetoacetate hydrolase family protein [Thermoplasmatota archaeon]